MDEPLFLNEERAYFGRIYIKVRDKSPLDKDEAAFLVKLIIRSQKNCLLARMQRDRGKFFVPSKTVSEATEAIKNVYAVHGHPTKRQAAVGL